MISQDFGAALRTDRFAMGLTQREFCDAYKEFTGADLLQQALARWETGAIPRHYRTEKLFEFLKHSFQVLGLESEVLKIGIPEPIKVKKSTKDLFKIIDDQSKEIAKLKEVIMKLIC